jgi:DNA polymerase-1
MGVNALRENLGTSREEATAFLEGYFATYSGLAAYMEDVKSSAIKTGYTETMFGRRRYFTGLNSPLPHIREQALRMAINAPIQGTSADIIKIAMVEIDKYIESEKLQDSVFMLLQIHDELVFEIKAELVKSAATAIKKIMESVITPERSKDVPLIVNVSCGENWGEMWKLWPLP